MTHAKWLKRMWSNMRILQHLAGEGCWSVYDGGVFGGFTRWAVVFLIIFVLFFLLVPGYGGYAGGGAYGAGAGMGAY
jgi:hypothetical protein